MNQGIIKAAAVKNVQAERTGFRKTISILAELSKVRITFFVALSATAGYVLHAGSVAFDMIMPVLGVFILACGSSALNHYQERKYDALMERTKKRPLPSGRITPDAALGVLTAMIATGLFLIYITVNLTAMAAGAAAVIWYNAVYTPMKRLTPMAVVPGALIGAIPPVIGWLAAGGSISDTEILIFALFVFIWQIPHFWLLLIIYSGDYSSAGYPVFSGKYGGRTLSVLTFIWILVLALFGSAVTFLGLTGSIYITLILALSGILLLWRSWRLLKPTAERKLYWKAFKDINNYVLFVVVLLSLSKIINL